MEKIKEYLDKLAVLGELYSEMANMDYPDNKEKEIAKLKMSLAKKEMLLLNYLIDKEL